MTVSSTRASTDPVATGNSVREWAFNFHVPAKEQARLAVIETATNEETYPSASLWDFTGGESGGTITYPKTGTDPLATGYQIRIDLTPPITQTTNLKSQGRYSPEDVEAALDHQMRCIQALAEEKNRLVARFQNLFDAFEGLDVGDLGSLQAYVTAAQAAATAAAASETEAEGAAAGAESSASSAAQAVLDVTALRGVVDSMIHGAAEYEPGKKSALGVLTEIQSVLTLAPSTNGRTIGDHTGEAGTDNVVQTFNAVVADLGAVVRFVRPALRPAKFKLVPDLLQMTSAAGFDEKYAFIRVINDQGGVSAVTIEGPADPSTPADVLLKPTIIASGTTPTADASATSAARTINVVLANIPAGANRKFKASCYFVGQTTPSGVVTLTCASALNITVRGSDGGTTGPSGTDPILTRVWTGDISGTAGLTNVTFAFAVPANLAACVPIVQVVNNASAHEDYVCTARDSTLTSEAATVDPSAALGSLVVVDAAHQGADALTGLTISGLDTVNTGKTPQNRPTMDLSYAMGHDADRATGSVSYTASSAKAAPGSITAVVFLPVTQSIGGGGEDNLITASVQELAPGEQADCLVHNGGIRYFLSLAAPKT